MFFRRLAGTMFCATMGIALTGSAFGQAQLEGGVEADTGQIDARASAADADASATIGTDGASAEVQGSTNGTNGVRADASANLNDDGAAGNAEIGTNGQNTNGSLNSDLNGNLNSDLNGDLNSDLNGNLNGNLNSDLDTNINASQNGAGIGTDGSANAGFNAFGASFDTNAGNSLVVRDAQQNSAAARLGLRSGDRIVSFNGQSYTNVDRFNSDLASFRGSTNGTLVFERDGRRYSRNFQPSMITSQNQYSNQSYGTDTTNYSAGRPAYGTNGNDAYGDQTYHSQSNSVGGSCCGANTYPGHSFQTGTYYNASCQTQACCQTRVHYRHRRHRCCR